ncbi:MAG TPA: hypothetical protein VFQ39_19270 [Longimicrobium sp.]|nr:hypothetical protein [Longimicrobium sp.]
MKGMKLNADSLRVESFAADEGGARALAEAAEALGITSFPNPCIPCTEVGPTCRCAEQR